MKKFAKKLSLFLVIVMLVTTLVTPAVTVNAAAYPTIALDSGSTGRTINVGESTTLVFHIYDANNYYSSATYNIFLYNSQGEEVGQLVERVSTYSSTWTLNLNIDTAALELTKGTYRLEFYMSWSDGVSWYKNGTNGYSYLYLVSAPRFENEGGIYRYYVDDSPSYETGLVKVNGSHFYIKNGIWQRYETGLIKFSGKWFYVVDGKWANKITTLVKINGQWFFIEKGKWISQNVLVKYQGKHFYIKSGKWQNNFKGFVKYKDKYFYIVSGKWANKTTTLVKYKGVYHYVKNGKFCETTTIFKYKGTRFYIKYGVAQLKFSGRVYYNGKYYTVKKGKVV